jgi:hypothetical protein
MGASGTPWLAKRPLIRFVCRPAIAADEQELAMNLAPILFGECGHLDDAPDLLLAAGRADEHRHELACIEAIRLRPSAAPIHLDARGIDDAVRNAPAHEIAMQPESIPASLVRTLHRGAGRQAKVHLRPTDLRLERREPTRRHRAHERHLNDPGGHRELPLSIAEHSCAGWS